MTYSRREAEKTKMINPIATSITNKNHSRFKMDMIFSSSDFIILY